MTHHTIATESAGRATQPGDCTEPRDCTELGGRAGADRDQASGVGDPAPSGPGFTTQAIHAAQTIDKDGYGAVVQPLYLTSTYAMAAPGQMRGDYDYARAGNPNRTALEDTLKVLEGADFAAAVSSGMAAETAILNALLRAGDTVMLPRDVYGGTVRLAEDEFERWGVQLLTVDTTDDAQVDAALAQRPRLVWIETPSNPRLDVLDIASLATRAHAAGALLVVDSTFASPYVQRPLELGADVVLHSTTKFIGGHSDVIGGAVLVKDQRESARPQPAGAPAPVDGGAADTDVGGATGGAARGAVAKESSGDGAADAGTASPVEVDDEGLCPVAAAIQRWIFNAGVGQAPFDTWLTLRGLKTLAVRMERHCRSALALARWLEQQPGVRRVFYPGLPSNPGHALATRQMRDFGGMVSFAAESPEVALRVCENVRVFTLAESLGGVESLIDHPATMTHRVLDGTPLAVDPAVIRLSIGLEDAEDLIADLRQALRG